MSEVDDVRIGVNSMFGSRTQQPLVALTIGDRKPICISPEEARRVAALLLECAEAALGDGFLMGWFREKIGASDADAVILLRQFRDYRHKRDVSEQTAQEKDDG